MEEGSNKPICLVTGSAGFVGSHLVDALLDRGYSVRALVRKTSNLVWLEKAKESHPDSFEYAWGDVTQPQTLEAAVSGVDYVYHVAGLIKALDEASYYFVNAGGTANLFESILASGRVPSRVVVVSSQAAVGPPRGEESLREESPPHPIVAYGRSKVREEAIAWRYSDRVPMTIVRPPSIYGPRDRETLTVFQWANRGLRLQPARMSRVSIVHVRDLARGMILAAESEQGKGEIFHLANPEPISLAELSLLIARSLGRERTISVSLPVAVFGVAGIFSELYGRIVGKPQIFDRSKARELAQPSWVMSAQKAKERLGFSPEIGLEAGLSETARWYRESGWL